MPEALPGAVAAATVTDRGDGDDEGGGDDTLEETPEGIGGETFAAEGVGPPDAESAAATGTLMAIAAKDAVSAEGFLAGLGLSVAVQMAVANESANGVAVRTGDEFELLGKGAPLVIVAEEVGHVSPRLLRTPVRIGV